jgi:hypothetical protein
LRRRSPGPEVRMRAVRRFFFVVVFASVPVSLALPFIGVRTSAHNYLTSFSSSLTPPLQQSTRSSSASSVVEAAQQSDNTNSSLSFDGTISKETLRALGLRQVDDPKAAGEKIAQMLKGKKKNEGELSIESGQPVVLNSEAPCRQLCSLRSVAETTSFRK